jgi:hypothetical protein
LVPVTPYIVFPVLYFAVDGVSANVRAESEKKDEIQQSHDHRT